MKAKMFETNALVYQRIWEHRAYRERWAIETEEKNVLIALI